MCVRWCLQCVLTDGISESDMMGSLQPERSRRLSLFNKSTPVSTNNRSYSLHQTPGSRNQLRHVCALELRTNGPTTAPSKKQRGSINVPPKSNLSVPLSKKKESSGRITAKQSSFLPTAEDIARRFHHPVAPSSRDKQLRHAADVGNSSQPKTVVFAADVETSNQCSQPVRPPRRKAKPRTQQKLLSPPSLADTARTVNSMFVPT